MEFSPTDLMTKMIKVTTVDQGPTLVALREDLHAPHLDHLAFQTKNRDTATSIFSMHYQEANPELVGDPHPSSHIIRGIVMSIFLEVLVFRLAIREMVAFMVGGTWVVIIHQLGDVEMGVVVP